MVKKDAKSKTRINILLVGTLFLATFVLVNAQEFLIAAFLYIVMGSLSLVLYSQWGRFGKLGDLEGIDENFIQDGFVGILLGIGTIILGSVFPVIGAIGIPQVQSIASALGRVIIIVPLASVFEEVFFRDLMFDFFDNKLLLPKILSNIIVAIFFAGFHLAAYGANLRAISGSLGSAALMGFIFGLVSERQNSLAGSIFYHATLNAWIGFFKLAVVIG